MVDATHIHRSPIENHNIHKNVQISMSRREKKEEYDLLYRLSRCNERKEGVIVGRGVFEGGISLLQSLFV